MDTFYTVERNTQIVIALMKAHGIKKMVVSPGTTNVRLVASVQQDSYFEMYSAVDERSAAYMACGLAAESGEAVALSCTGATASRNYVPGLTEAFYRKLPILAITSTQHRGRIGQNVAQVIDRSTQMPDIVRMSTFLPSVKSDEDEWTCVVQANKAMLELTRHGGGPVHIDLETEYRKDFSVKELPEVRVIFRIMPTDDKPQIPKGRVCVFVGAHKAWSEKETKAINDFCEAYNAVVLCDQTSNYKGKYRVLFNIVTNQKKYLSPCREIDLLIHIGDTSGAYPDFHAKSVWRVNPDGEIRDTFKKLRYVFEMAEEEFFVTYSDMAGEKHTVEQLSEWKAEEERMRSKVPELPFSNIWIASQTASRLPEGSVLHLGILNSLRSWNLFDTPTSVLAYSNTGGFGIDGGMSSMIGASLADKNKLYYLMIGDLAFFYDMNSLGNRHVGSNIRILLVNNGVGTEFKNYNHPAAQFGDDADDFIAARGHYGRQSRDLVMHYAQDLGFEYITASGKEDYLKNLELFTSSEHYERPILFEVFTNSEDESNALKIMNNLDESVSGLAKQVVKKIVGDSTVKTIKKMMGR